MSENQEPYRIGFEEYQTPEGQTFFTECIRATENFLRSKILNKETAEELSQEIALKILKKLKENREKKIDCGYFINFAKNILLENYRKLSENKKRFVEIENAEDSESVNHPTDAKNLKDHETRHKNLPFHECILESYQNLSEEQQIMLYRYSYIADEHSLGENSKDNNFIGGFFDFIKETTKQFFSMQNTNEPMTKEEKAKVRLKVHRLRERLKVLVIDCIGRKKGLI
jgi:DNA-directed RNA polymerase specialized sigma24 family protein